MDNGRVTDYGTVRGKFLDRFAELEELLDVLLAIYLSRSRPLSDWRSARLRSKPATLLFDALLPKLRLVDKISVTEKLLKREGLNETFPDLVKRLRALNDGRNLFAHRRVLEYINLTELPQSRTSTEELPPLYVAVQGREFGGGAIRGPLRDIGQVDDLFDKLAQAESLVNKLGDVLFGAPR